MFVETFTGDAQHRPDVPEDRRRHPHAVPGIVDYRVIDDQCRAAMLDLFDKVPEEQRGHPIIAGGEERVVVIEHQLEHRRERCLQIGGVRQPILQGLVRGEVIEGGDHLVQGLLEPRITLDQTLRMLAVAHGVLALLPHKRIGLSGDHRIGDQRHRFGNHLADHLLECDRQEGNRIGHARKGRIGLVP
ncbi:Uncharacterised protein [Mycobacteroides abscessus subsp. abscessus]|nr:Uncharacterised protein [Mycobacteroides abscessus subsp. abscessus]